MVIFLQKLSKSSDPKTIEPTESAHASKPPPLHTRKIIKHFDPHLSQLDQNSTFQIKNSK
jgi:hypothetical protein